MICYLGELITMHGLCSYPAKVSNRKVVGEETDEIVKHTKPCDGKLKPIRDGVDGEGRIT